jgi:hypothetical protein
VRQPALPGSGLGRVQLERAGVDAVALTGGVGAVVEHVPEMTAAALAQHLGAPHEQAPIFAQLDVLGDRGFVEARPAGPRLEFGVGVKQLSAAAGAAVRAVVLDVDVVAGERSLGGVFAQYLVLLGRESRPPFLVGQMHFAFGVHARER